MLNSPAPDFSLEASNGQQIDLQDLKGSFVVLIFYPLNDSPTCNRQLKDMELNIQDFLLENARVFGVNTAPVEKQRAYCTRKRLQFPVLSDAGGAVAKKYKAHMLWLPFNLRTVVVIDPNSTICFYRRGVPNPKDILDTIKSKALSLGSQAPVEPASPQEAHRDKS